MKLRGCFPRPFHSNDGGTTSREKATLSSERPPAPTPEEVVFGLMLQSEFLKSAAAAQASTHESRGLRLLSTDEIRTLKEQHNAAEEWSRVWVGKDFNPHKVVGCYFSGDVELGIFKERIEIEPGVKIGTGVYNCDLKNVS